MTILLIFGVLFTVGAVLAIIFCRGDGATVRHSRALPITALLAALASCTICFLDQSALVAALLAAAFLIAGAALLMAFLFWKICYTDETFEVHSFLKRKKAYSMWEVNGITEGQSTTLLHLKNGKKVRIDAKGSNAGDFIDAVEWHYREVQRQGVALPDVPAGLFRGYVQNPGQFVFIFCMVLSLELCALGAMWVAFSATQKLPDELVELSVTEFSATLDDDTLYIQTDELEQPFTCISFRRVLAAKGQTADAFFDGLEQQKKITISVSGKMLRKAYADDCKFIRIYRLAGGNGDILLQHEEISEGYRANAASVLYAVMAVFVLTLLFVIFFCYVVARAPRYPRLVRLLVKEDWLNI